jgi:sulfofructose kinase
VRTDPLAYAAAAPTSRSAVLVDPAGERTIVNHRDPLLMATSPGDLDAVSLDAALADTRWPAGAAALARAARAQGRPVVIDAEAPVMLAGEALMLATHVAFSEQGLADFAGTGDAHEGLRIAAERLPAAWLCVTRGPAPVLSLTDGAFAETPAFAVATVDTLGAGDVWHGAFAVGLAEGRPAPDALRRANAAAALSTTAPGLSSLPDRAALDAFLQETDR